MSDTYQTWCHACNERTDFLCSTDEKPVCADCKDKFGEKCLKGESCQCADFCACGNEGVNENGFCGDCI